MNYKKVVLVLVLIFAGCGGPKTVFQTYVTKQSKIAVLPFSSHTSMSSQNYGLYCSTTFTKELILQKKARVVDNTLTNAALSRLDILSVNRLTKTHLTQLAEALDVDVLVMGDLDSWQNENTELSLETGEVNFQLSVRFLDPKTGLVLGVVSQNKSGKEQPQVLLASLINSVVADIELKEGNERQKTETDNDG